MKKLFSVLFVLLLSLALMGAGTAEGADAVAVVNGETVTAAELDSMVQSLSSRMAAYGIDTEDADTAALLRTLSLQELVEDRLLTQDMTAQGVYAMTEDEENAIVLSAQQALASLTAEYTAAFQEYLGGEELEGLTAEALAQRYLLESGYTQEYLENYYRNALASEKYEQWLGADAAAVTDAEVQAEYDRRVAESKEAHGGDVSAFETALANGEETWYRPAGYRAFLQIMLAASGENDEEKLRSVQDATDEIYAKLENGADFASLMAEYGQDEYFRDGANLDVGYQVHPQSILWEDAFVAAAFGEAMRQPGDVSQPLVFGDNVSILYYLRDVPEGPVEMTDALLEALRQDLENARADQRLQERLAHLKEQAEIVYP